MSHQDVIDLDAGVPDFYSSAWFLFAQLLHMYMQPDLHQPSLPWEINILQQTR